MLCDSRTPFAFFSWLHQKFVAYTRASAEKISREGATKNSKKDRKVALLILFQGGANGKKTEK